VKEKEEKTHRPEDEMNTYSILLQRHLNDDRLMAERSTIFLASSSILFLGFVMLLPTGGKFPIFVACIGIVLCLLAIISNWRTRKGLDFWGEKEKEIEKNGQSSTFKYMQDKKMMPHLVYEKSPEWMYKWKLRNRHIYTYWLPFFFIALWISSLIWVLLN